MLDYTKLDKLLVITKFPSLELKNTCCLVRNEMLEIMLIVDLLSTALIHFTNNIVARLYSPGHSLEGCTRCELHVYVCFARVVEKKSDRSQAKSFITKEKWWGGTCTVARQIALTQSGDKLNVLMFSLAQFFVF